MGCDQICLDRYWITTCTNVITKCRLPRLMYDGARPKHLWVSVKKPTLVKQEWKWSSQGPPCLHTCLSIISGYRKKQLLKICGEQGLLRVEYFWSILQFGYPSIRFCCSFWLTRGSLKGLLIKLAWDIWLKAEREGFITPELSGLGHNNPISKAWPPAIYVMSGGMIWKVNYSQLRGF